MMVEKGEADAFISGLSNDYPKTILPALQIIGVEPGVNRVAGMYIISNSKYLKEIINCIFYIIVIM